MSRKVKLILAVCLLTAAVLSGLAAFGTSQFWSGMCANQFLASAVSPDGSLKAVVFERGCGATTGFSTQVSVIAAGGDLPNEAGNVFVCAGGPGGSGGGPPVAVRWEGPRQLAVHYPSKANTFEQTKRMTVRLGWFRRETVAVMYTKTQGR